MRNWKQSYAVALSSSLMAKCSSYPPVPTAWLHAYERHESELCVTGSGAVAEAVKAELERLKQTDSGLAASALALAAAVDTPDSTTSLSMCARELRETLATLRTLAAAKHEPDRLDDLAARRRERIA